ncbi:MAG: LD-carboxypeptidase [Phycisphaerales bacterium]|nr:LD-carboxypeptidase [Phycisphaerales bacterium]
MSRFRSKTALPRIHLLGHANPSAKDFPRLGVRCAAQLIERIRAALPEAYRLTAEPRILEAAEDQQRGGRRDDRARVRDIHDALRDPATVAIIALNGGAYFSRILPDIDLSPLDRRARPLLATGFSEMTGWVNLVARRRFGRGVYWLCPNYLGWKIAPPPAAHSAYDEFWRRMPEWLERFAGSGQAAAARRNATPTERRSRAVDLPNARTGRVPGSAQAIACAPLRGTLVQGSAAGGAVRLAGGCLSVLTTCVGGPIGRIVDPRGRWLLLEDVNEAPYRVDRMLASLRVAGWLERVAGVLIGDFHTAEQPDHRRAVLEVLRFHLSPARRTPVVLTRSFGHVWPMTPLPLNRPLRMQIRGRSVTLSP